MSVSSTLITVAQKPLCFLGSAISSVSSPCFLLSKNSLICAPAIYNKYKPPKTWISQYCANIVIKKIAIILNTNAPARPYINACFCSLGGKCLTITAKTIALSAESNPSKSIKLNNTITY